MANEREKFLRSKNRNTSTQRVTRRYGVDKAATGVTPTNEPSIRDTQASFVPSGRKYSMWGEGVGLAEADRQAAMMDRQAAQAGLSSLSGRSGGRGGGYGGGGGTSASAAAKAQAEGLQSLLRSNAFDGQSIDADLARIASAVTADQAAATTASDRYADFVNSQGNPMADVELASAVRLDPELEAMLLSQGGDVGAYKAELGLANTLAAEGETADERFRRAMAASTKAARGQDLAANEQAAEFARAELAAAGGQASEAVRARKRAEDKALRDQRMQIVLQLIAANASRGEGTDVAGLLGGA